MSEAVITRLGQLAAELRCAGVRVGVGELLGAHRALAAVDSANREQCRLALRAVMCSQRGDLQRFERAFVTVFGEGRLDSGGGPLAELGTIEKSVLPRAVVPGGASPADGILPAESTPVPVAWSDVELLRKKDFARYTEAEMVLARELIGRLAQRAPVRRSRRTRPVRGRGHTADLRRILRASLRTGGEPVHRHWRAPTTRPRPVVLVCDISGSMAPYARILLQYMHACVTARRRVEAFAFGTRLTRITNELAGRDHDQALRRAAESLFDFAGGTRIGASLAELNRVHGRRLGRGAAVVILSDGWDRGDPDELGVEMARLRRSAHRLVWLNPLAAHPEYEPLTRGMRAAIPFADELLAGNTLESLEHLAETLEEM